MLYLNTTRNDVSISANNYYSYCAILLNGYRNICIIQKIEDREWRSKGKRGMEGRDVGMNSLGRKVGEHSKTLKNLKARDMTGVKETFMVIDENAYA